MSHLRLHLEMEARRDHGKKYVCFSTTYLRLG